MSFFVKCLFGTNKPKDGSRKTLSESHIDVKALERIDLVLNENIQTFDSTQSMTNQDPPPQTLEPQKSELECGFTDESGTEKQDIDKKSAEEDTSGIDDVHVELKEDMSPTYSPTYEENEMIASLRSKSPVITRSLPQFEPEKKSRFSLEKKGYDKSIKSVVSKKSTLQVSPTIHTHRRSKSAQGKQTTQKTNKSKSNVYRLK